MLIQIPAAYDELIRYLAERAAPEEILAFSASPDAAERAELLLEKSRDGTLTLEERIELDQMAHFDRLVGLLKSAALQKLGAA